MRLIKPSEIALHKLTDDEIDRYIGEYERGWNHCIDSILEEIQQIDAEPVRHGTWELKARIYGKDLFSCSECGREEIVYNRHSHDMAKRYPYCHCGAKMC